MMPVSFNAFLEQMPFNVLQLLTYIWRIQNIIFWENYALDSKKWQQCSSKDDNWVSCENYSIAWIFNRKGFWNFQGLEKGCIENEWVKDYYYKYFVEKEASSWE